MSYETTLFAHIAPRFTDRIEDIAVEALGHILSQSELARSALADTLRAGGTEIGSIDRIQTQVIGDEGERPDLVGLDDSRVERVLIEAKFWAGLTENQPNQYLKRLPDDTPAALLLLAPAARLETLWPELCRRAEEAGFTLTGASNEGNLRSFTIGGGVHRLQLTSWAVLLDALAVQASDAADTAAVSNISQLRGLTDRMDAEAFLPWRSEDLGPDFARRMLGLIGLIDDATNRGRTYGFLNTDGLKKSPRYEGYGRFIRIGGVEAWFGIECASWARHHGTPLWLLFKHDEHENLNQTGLTGSMVDFNWRFRIPITLPTAVAYDTVLESVVASLRSIAEQLDPPGPGRPEGEE